MTKVSENIGLHIPRCLFLYESAYTCYLEIFQDLNFRFNLTKTKNFNLERTPLKSLSCLPSYFQLTSLS